MKLTPEARPQARTQALVVENLPDETLVYDLDRDVAHCLNRTASFVWQHCDGCSTPQQIARSLSLELQRPVDKKLVWFALQQLDRHHLLAQRIEPQSPLLAVGRREVLRAMGVVTAVTLPVVASIMAPTPAQAATGCKPGGAACSSGIECCSGICNGGTCAPST